MVLEKTKVKVRAYFEWLPKDDENKIRTTDFTYENIKGISLEEIDEVFTNEEDKNLAKTAKRLFVHKNTLKYRIDKIKKICQCDFKDHNDTFNIQMALYIKSFLGEDMDND